MKEKYEEMLRQAKSLLAEAEAFIAAEDYTKASEKQEELKALNSKLEVIKSQLNATAETRLAELEAENTALKTAAATPARLPFDSTEEEPVDDGSEVKSFNTIRYGELGAAVKAVIGDLYGNKFNYMQAREDQMKAFAKYVRRGASSLNTKEDGLLHANSKTILLQPDVIEAEIKSGRSVAEIKATLEEGSNELGGYLVPEDYRTEIVKRLVGQTFVRGRARVITTTRDAVEWPKLEQGSASDMYTSAVRVQWVDETPASPGVANTNPTWSLQRVPVHTVMARADLSRNLLEDSAFNLLEIMADLFAEAMAIDEDTQFLTGTGGGRPKGLLGERANGTNETPVLGVPVEVSGNASLLTPDGLVNLVYAIPTQYRAEAILTMSRNTQRDIRKFKDGDGRYMWQAGITAGQPASILGYPLYESQIMPAIGANNHPIVFGNWRMGYVIVDRVGMSIERVVDTGTVGTNTVALFARRRLGGQVVAPWAFAAQKVSA